MPDRDGDGFFLMMKLLEGFHLALSFWKTHWLLV